MTSQRTKESFSQIDINGARLAYEELGQGETVVLVHPIISDLRCWDLIKPKTMSAITLPVYKGPWVDFSHGHIQGAALALTTQPIAAIQLTLQFVNDTAK
ncbi:hypothetical protein LTS09_017748 [Friedmanniomyces endolithicus]|nr:hypothetical protein LTS09_017748 [Friedmanniomyces endolithicus]